MEHINSVFEYHWYDILPFAKQKIVQSNIKETMKVSTRLSMHLCLAQRPVDSVIMLRPFWVHYIHSEK